MYGVFMCGDFETNGNIVRHMKFLNNRVNCYVTNKVSTRKSLNRYTVETK